MPCNNKHINDDDENGENSYYGNNNNNNNSYNQSHWNNNEKLNEKTGSCIRKAFGRFTTEDSYS
jgi:hypothetical protein